MLTFIFGAVLAGSPLLIGELMTRMFGVQKEYARKTVHVLGSLASGLLVVFMDLPEIVMLGLLFCVIMFFVRRYKLVSALYQVDRKSYGELYFPAGVAAAAALAPNDSTYVLAMAILGLSDTAANLVGTAWGKPLVACTFVANKSLLGSLAFFIVTYALLAAFSNFSFVHIAAISLATTGAELLAPRGADNLAIPMVATLSMLVLTA